MQLGRLQQRRDALVTVNRSFLIAIVLLLNCIFKTHTSGDLIKKSTERAQEMGLNPSHYIIAVDTGNFVWKQKERTITTQQKSRLSNLKKRQIQVVKLSIKKGILGGDIWFFFDKRTGFYIDMYGEK